MSVTWGSVANSKGRIGIDASISKTTSTSVTVTIAIWFWSKWGVSDSSNTLYFNDNKSSATTSKGSVSVSTSVSSGDGWSTSNQKKLKTYTVTVSRGTSAKTRKCSAKLTGIEAVGSTMSVTASYTVPKLDTYTITYNANGGEGAPSKTTGYVGKSVKLSSTEPERENYEFLGWGTSASATTAKYQPGASVSFTSNTTLYAIWVQNVYKITYSAGNQYDFVDLENIPESQTKAAGGTITIGGTSNPSAYGLQFVDWTGSDGNTYKKGDTYSTDKNLKLTANWSRDFLYIEYYKDGEHFNSGLIYYGSIHRILSTVPTKDGYVFKCWCTSSEISEDSVCFYPRETVTYDGIYALSEYSEVNLYAIWITRDVLIHDTGEIEAISFVEDSNRCINKLGEVHYPELIEGDAISLSDGSVACTEFIEK